MSTGGTCYFEIEESGVCSKVGKLVRSSDAYPSWFGREMSKKVEGVVVGEGGSFLNVERVILHMMWDEPSDIFDEDEYIYRFILKKVENGLHPIEEILRVEVTHKYDRNNFSGTLEEFIKFCND